MREIKFRAWEKEIKHMFTYEELDNATGGLVAVGNDALKESGCELMPGGLFIPTKDKKMVIMQYVGIKDINDKEMYEGDIVKLKGRSIELLGEIVYNSDDCAFELHDPIGDCYELMFYEGQEYEIVGNRYENPDILEE